MRHKHVSQETANMGDPHQHAAWALKLAPTVGSGAITHPQILADWSKHLHDCGFRHVDEIAKLADEDGNIHVSKLPKQKVKLQPAFEGQRNGLNAAARWVPIDHPDPPQLGAPDINDLSAVHREAVLNQFKEAGEFVDRYAPDPDVASVEW